MLEIKDLKVAVDGKEILKGVNVKRLTLHVIRRHCGDHV
jgi:Fe-S cluster assembly ATPase SufC